MTTIYLENIKVEIQTETDIECKLEKITEQVELSEMLDEYADNEGTLKWVADNCTAEEISEGLHTVSDPKEPRRETVGNGMGYKWILEGMVRAVGVMRPHGTLTMNVLDNSDTLHTFVSDSIEGADMLVRWMVNA